MAPSAKILLVNENRGASVAQTGLLLAMLFLSACAPEMNAALHTANAAGIVAGFWRGLWHGMIAPITFLISLFDSRIGVYEAHNNGGWYNFGFIIGITWLHGRKAAQRAARRVRNRPRAVTVVVAGGA